VILRLIDEYLTRLGLNIFFAAVSALKNLTGLGWIFGVVGSRLNDTLAALPGVLAAAGLAKLDRNEPIDVILVPGDCPAYLLDPVLAFDDADIFLVVFADETDL